MAGRRIYVLLSPGDRLVRAACQDAGCDSWRHGWQTVVDERTSLGLAQATYIRQGSGRTFTELSGGPGITVFRFEAGQRCFAEHRTRPQHLLVRDRGTVRQHASAADWLEDATEHLSALADLDRKG